MAKRFNKRTRSDEDKPPPASVDSDGSDGHPPSINFSPFVFLRGVTLRQRGAGSLLAVYGSACRYQRSQSSFFLAGSVVNLYKGVQR